MYGLENNAVRSSEHVASNVKVIWEWCIRRNVAAIGHICVILSAIFFLRRTSRCVYKLQTNRYNSVKHNHLFFYSGWITCFGLGRPSSGQQMFLFQPYRNNSLPIRSNLPKRNLRGERNAISFTLTSSSKVYLLAIPSYTLSARSRYPPPLRPECDMLTRPALQQSCNRTTANVSTITVKYQSEFQIFLRFAEISCFSLSRRHNPL